VAEGRRPYMSLDNETVYYHDTNAPKLMVVGSMDHSYERIGDILGKVIYPKSVNGAIRGLGEISPWNKSDTALQTTWGDLRPELVKLAGAANRPKF